MDEKVKATISALVILAVSLLSMYGIDVDGDLAANLVLTLVGGIAVLYGCWKNHNFTEAAVAAQSYLDWLKEDEEAEEGEPDEQ